MRTTSLFFAALCICLMNQNTLTPIHAQQTIPPSNAETDSPTQPFIAPSDTFDELTPRAYMPIVIGGTNTVTGSCGITSTASYGLIGIDGGFYKNNALTDENADFRLSLIGYSATLTSTNSLLKLVDYNGDTDSNAPRLHGVFEPNRFPGFKRNYQRYDWNWNESDPPPYGLRGGVNNDWDVSVVEFSTMTGEAIRIPERTPEIGGGFHAMVLYAGQTELTLTYQRSDGVGNGYVIHMHGLCVDSNLVALYRTQLDGGGRRKTGSLPAIKNNQRVGTASGNTLTVAIRDNGAFLDPRSKKDWWQGLP